MRSIYNDFVVIKDKKSSRPIKQLLIDYIDYSTWLYVR